MEQASAFPVDGSLCPAIPAMLSCHHDFEICMMILYSRKQMIVAWFQIRTTCWTFQVNPPKALQEFSSQALSHTGRTPFIIICGNFFFTVPV